MRIPLLLLSLLATNAFAESVAIHQNFVKRDPVSNGDTNNIWTAMAAPIPNSPQTFLFTQTFADNFMRAYTGDGNGFTDLAPFSDHNQIYFDRGDAFFRGRFAIVNENGATAYHAEAEHGYSISTFDGKDFHTRSVLKAQAGLIDTARCDGYANPRAIYLSYSDAAFSPSQELVAITETCRVGYAPEDVYRANLVFLNRHDGARVGDVLNVGPFEWLNDATILASHPFDALFPSKEAFGIYLVDVKTRTKKLVHEAKRNAWFFKPKASAGFLVLEGKSVLEFSAGGALLKTRELTGLPCESYGIDRIEGSDDGSYLALSKLTCAGQKGQQNVLISVNENKVSWSHPSEMQRPIRFLSSRNLWVLVDETTVHAINPNDAFFSSHMLSARTLEFTPFPTQCHLPEETSVVIDDILPTPDGQFLAKYACYWPGYLHESQWFGGFAIGANR